jgi:hypothetical protein
MGNGYPSWQRCRRLYRVQQTPNPEILILANIVLLGIQTETVHPFAQGDTAVANRPQGRRSHSAYIRLSIMMRSSPHLSYRIGKAYERQTTFETKEGYKEEKVRPTTPHYTSRSGNGEKNLSIRQIVDEIYRLFDRRCRTSTALSKLAVLRKRVQHFSKLNQVLKGLFSANVEKALTFLDDLLLGTTSNAVERVNRRYRKMQNSVYRIRTYTHLVARMALDLFRDALMPSLTYFGTSSYRENHIVISSIGLLQCRKFTPIGRQTGGSSNDNMSYILIL